MHAILVHKVMQTPQREEAPLGRGEAQQLVQALQVHGHMMSTSMFSHVHVLVFTHCRAQW